MRDEAPHVDELVRPGSAESAAQQSGHASEARLQRERPWRYAVVALLGTLLLALLFTPGVPLHQKLASVLQGLCAQDHTLSLAGMVLPICARCTGIYTSLLTTAGLLWLFGRKRAGGVPPWHITAALVGFVLLMGLDGVNSFFETARLPTAYTPMNELRTLTGLGMGMAVAVLILLLVNLSLRRDVDQQLPILKNWWEVGGILLVNVLLLGAAFGNLNFMYWPLAFLSFTGMLGTLYSMNVIVCSVFMGYSNAITSPVQLAKPAMIAIIPTLAIVGTLWYLRFWLDTQIALL